MTGPLFPFHDYWWFYAAFTGSIVGLLVLDLGVFHRKAHVIGFREASAWTAVWAALALLFCLGLYKYAVWKFGAITGKQIGVEFLTGYVVEWSLSLDNMFVFLLVFRYFGPPALLQHRILFYGILGALIFRGVFVVLGAELLQLRLGRDPVRCFPDSHRHQDDVFRGAPDPARTEPHRSRTAKAVSRSDGA